VRLVCAWCHADIRQIFTVDSVNPGTSHGICQACLRDFERRQSLDLLALVEELPHPALAVDADLRIQAANQLVCSLFRRDWVSLMGHRLGSFLGCTNGEPEGDCDVDPLCPGCALHLLVRHTFQSGKSGITALSSLPGKKPHPLTNHRVTTLRVGDLVALRIDPLRPVVLIT